jgi:tryptophan 2,3-dioxygenase
VSDLTYAEYLRLPVLLSLQQPRHPEPVEPDVVQAERFFIVTHQCCELWLGQVIGDVDTAVEALAAPHKPDGLELALEYLSRAAAVLGLLHEHVLCLEKLPLRGFAAFRPYLGTASGMQSDGFRQLDQRLGNDRRSGPLYGAYVEAVAWEGRTVAEVCALGPNAGVLHHVAEALLDLGSGYWRWKVAHLALVVRLLGVRPGTGRTRGVGFLERRLVMPFGELRRLRAEAHHAGD